MFDSIITFEFNANMFLATVGSSAFSAILAGTKFLMLGPCKLVTAEGLLGGHGRFGFLLLFLNSGSISQCATSTYTFWVRGIRWSLGPSGSQNYGLNFPAEPSCWEMKIFILVWKNGCFAWNASSQQLSMTNEQTIYHLKDLGARISHMLLFLFSVNSALRNCK